MDEKKYNKGGTAGSKGVKFQVGLLTVSLLNALRRLSDWRLSTENNRAGKFDDMVLECPEGAVLLQAKHRETRTRITEEELMSTNSKRTDFSLPKYFLSYLEIKDRFALQNLIICTNAELNERALKFLKPQRGSSESFLHYEDASFYTLKKEILPELKEKSMIYCQQNLQNKGIDESIITDENLEAFLKYLQLYFDYPAGDNLDKGIEKLLQRAGWLEKVSPSEIYGKVMDWFQQKNGKFITEFHAKAMFSEIRGDKYWQSLEKYRVFFQNNDLNIEDSKKVYHFITDETCLLQNIRLYRGLQDKKKVLCIFPDDDIENQKQLIQAFGLRGYVYLIIFWPKLREEFLVKEMWDKIEEILDKCQYKKIILLTEGNNKLFRQIESSCVSVETREPPRFQDLSEVTQDMLLKRKNMIFQGNVINLEELFSPNAVKDYETALNLEMLEKLVKNEEKIKVGSELGALDEDIGNYYIHRNFFRNTKTIEEEDIFETKEKVIIISDNAGLGKTTVLTKLALTLKERNPQFWIIKIELCHYSKVLKELLRKKRTTIGIRELLDSREATKLTNNFEELIMSMNDKVILMMDGVDEISPIYTGLIVNLLVDCQKASNLAKIIITTRPHLMSILKNDLLHVNPFKLQPFSETNQLDFLTSYWSHHLKLDHTSKEKCERYAKALMSRVTSRLKLTSREENGFGAIPLHMRMLAEIFEEHSEFKGIALWEGCIEFLNADRLEPNLSENIDISKLYEMFLDKKRTVFVDKGNPSGNASAEEALLKQFEECLDYHRTFALNVILDRTERKLFSCYKEDNKNMLENVLKIGIIQEENNRLHFVHRTFAEYFVAECLIEELQLRTQNEEFQKFLIDVILQYSTRFIGILHFFDNSLQNHVDNLANNIFRKYQSLSYEIDLYQYDFPCSIHYLAQEGCVAVLQLLLKCVNFEVIRGKETTISELYQENKICTNRLDILESFVRRFGLNIKDIDANTPLHLAARKGHFEMVKFLVEQGANINIGGIAPHVTILNQAVKGGHLNIVRFLVEQGADIETNVRQGGNDLFTAIKGNHVNILTYLFEKILNENGLECGLDLKYSMVPFVAAYLGRLDVLETLLDKGLNFNNCRILNKESPIFGAAMGKQIKTIEYLLQHGADINSKDICNETALHAIAKDSSLTCVATVLLRLGINIDAENSYNFTALHQAAEAGAYDMMELLVKNKANVNVRDKIRSNTVLHTTVDKDNLDMEVVKLLVDHNADINIRYNTVLHLLADRGRLDAIKYLGEFGVDTTIKNIDGYTALHIALRKGQLDVAKFLVERDCCAINTKDNIGQTPLHLTVSIDIRIIKSLWFLLTLHQETVDDDDHSNDTDDNNDDNDDDYDDDDGDDKCIDEDWNYFEHMLIHRIISEQLDMVRFLMDHNAKINDTNNIGQTVLHVAILRFVKDYDIYGCCDYGFSIIKFLLEQGAKINTEDISVVWAKEIQKYYCNKNLMQILRLPLFKLLESTSPFNNLVKRHAFAKKGSRRRCVFPIHGRRRHICDFPYKRR